jgi:transposase InsO family protein
MTDLLHPRDHGEAVAHFRHALIGALLARDLSHGELACALRALAQQRHRPPDSNDTRSYSVPTLERWLYAFRSGGMAALRPAGRSDRGRGRLLGAELRTLLCDIRREHPDASVPLILRTLEADGRIECGKVSASTVRKLLREQGLDRVALRNGQGPKTRLRWQTALPDALWQGDVCHGPTLTLGGQRTPVRIHGLIDDYSRYLVALEAHPTEREDDMLGVLVRAIRIHGKPDTLYLDNGSTYRGDTLRTACSRLGISLLHTRPYDPAAKGKMERFWRRLREQCLDHLGHIQSLDDVNARLRAFLDRYYLHQPHAGLLGRAPASLYDVAERMPVRIEENALREALTVRETRRIRRDTTLAVDGETYEIDQGYLAGRTVTVGYCWLDSPRRPWIEADGQTFPCHVVDPVRNAHRPRPPRRPIPSEPSSHVSFDPSVALTTPTEDPNDDCIF